MTPAPISPRRLLEDTAPPTWSGWSRPSKRTSADDQVDGAAAVAGAPMLVLASTRRPTGRRVRSWTTARCWASGFRARSFLENLDALLRQAGRASARRRGACRSERGPGASRASESGSPPPRDWSSPWTCRPLGVPPSTRSRRELRCDTRDRREAPRGLRPGPRALVAPTELEQSPGSTVCVGDGAVRYRGRSMKPAARCRPRLRASTSPRARFHAGLCPTTSARRAASPSTFVPRRRGAPRRAP